MCKTTCASVNSWRIKLALESYIEEHAQEISERNWMNPEMHTTLLNMKDLKPSETILNALIPLECEQILKD